ncbi:MAG: GNAT family N-acetyltransferase [Desulfobacteraceae bacterium]|nr:GNAT family N-acetyltransferase [Desulfobacteraceae bacterium]MCF8096017.1 GNAT family N-acetyltransferase [Desulfobacteraceae bacterium]
MSREKLQIRRAEYSDAPGWDDYIAANRDGLAYHRFAWKQAIEASYGFDCPYFLAEQNNRICGVLPTAHIHFPIDKGQLVSLPYCDVGGIFANHPEIADALFNHACDYARAHKIAKIEIRTPPAVSAASNPDKRNTHKKGFAHDNPGPTGVRKVRMLLELQESSDALLATFKSKLRSQVKKPAREGLFSRLGGQELLKDFYPVFAENMRDLGSPVHSKNWLRNVLKHYGENARCGVVYMPDQTPAAAGIILCHNHVVSIPWASSLQRFNRFNPNMFLYWTFLEFAADKGYRFFDFGRSTPGEGTYKFKAQWGAKPQPLNWQRWMISNKKEVQASSEPAVSSSGGTRDVAEQIISKTPLPVATFLGSRLRKYITL